MPSKQPSPRPATGRPASRSPENGSRFPPKWTRNADLRTVIRQVPPRTWDNLDEPYFDVTEDRHVIARDVLQVINYLNYAQTGDPDEGDQGETMDGGITAEPWLPLTPQTLGRSLSWPASHPETAADLRVDLLTAASEESAELLGRDLQQPAVRRPGTQPLDRFLRNRTQPDSEWEEDLPDWDSLLEEQATDQGSLDAFFAALA